MDLIKIFAAWILFVMAMINLGREMRTYARDPKSQHHDWMALIRGIFTALCFGGWWILIK